MEKYLEDYLGFEKIFDTDDTTQLLFRMAIEFIFAYVVINRVYCRRYQSSDHVFTFWLFSIVTFSIAFLLRKVPMELGFALGLFAVFGVLRYRTESIGVKDLTYLFIVIGLALINALANKKISLTELMIVNTTISAAVFLIDGSHRDTHEHRLAVTFDRVDLLGADKRPELIAELSRRLSLSPTRVEVIEVDLLRDIARLSVYFQATGPQARSIPPSAPTSQRNRA